MMNKAKEEKGAASAELTEELASLGTDLPETKASDWDSRSKTRTSELTAIASALEMLKGDVSKMYGSTDLGLVTKRAPKVHKAAPVKASKDALRAAMRDVAKEEKAAGGHWQWIPDHVATLVASSAPAAAPTASAAPAADDAAKEDDADAAKDDDA